MQNRVPDLAASVSSCRFRGVVNLREVRVEVPHQVLLSQEDLDEPPPGLLRGPDEEPDQLLLLLLLAPGQVQEGAQGGNSPPHLPARPPSQEPPPVLRPGQTSASRPCPAEAK